jgi:type II secretory pathway pseudopilin PulG
MNKQSGFSLIGMLLAIILIAVAYYFIAKSNFSTATLLDKKTKKVLTEQGINTSDYKKMIDTTQSKVDEINKKIIEQQKKIQDIK